MNFPATQPDDGSVSNAETAAPRTDASFLATRSLKQQLLDELCEPSAAKHVEVEDLLGRWPNDTAGDRDVAGLLFQDFRQRSVRGDQASLDEYADRFPEHKDSLASLVRRHDFLRSITSGSESSLPTLSLPSVGEELFGFRLRQQLGQGGFARVFLAEQAELADRAVALKISDLSSNEPQTLAQLQHTYIVPIYSVHEDVSAGVRAVCMPYFGGASLSQVLRDVWARAERPTRGAELVSGLSRVGGPAPAAAVALANPAATAPTCQTSATTPVARLARLNYTQGCMWIVARLAEGLQHAHDRGVLHRDIKPANILLAADGTPLLLDFNLAHDDNQSRAAVEATLGGTVAYMAPEHLRALHGRSAALLKQVDQRSDIYGLGMVLFEMITNHNPFEQKASFSPVPILVEAMAAERSRHVSSLRRARPDVPWGLESIVRKCLQPDPAGRYQRAEHLAEDLDRLLADQPLEHAPELSRTEQARKWGRRHPRLASSGLIATVAAALLAAGGALLMGTQSRLAVAQTRAYEAEGAEAQQRKQEFERGTLRALCLVNTHSDSDEHAAQGRDVCEQTLALYDILDTAGWQRHPAWQRLSVTEQQKLADDARELLLLLSGARVRLAARGDSDTLQAALHLLDRAEAIQGLPSSAAIWQARAAYLRQLGDADAALAADQKASSIRPSSARDFYLLATAHLQGGAPDQYVQAIRELEQALRLDPRHYWSWMQKGLCHLQLGEHPQALADFGVCVGLWPEFAWGYFNRGFTLDQVGQKSAAIGDYTAALARDSKLTAAWQNRGVAELEVRQYAAALLDFDALIELGRNEPAVQALRGQALEGLQRHEEADAAFAAAFANLDTAAETVRNQIWCAYGFSVCGRLPDAARQAFAKVPAGDPKYPDALYGLGLLAANQSHTEDAITRFSESLGLRPAFEPARAYPRDPATARLGRLAEAVADINMTLQAAPKSGPALYAAACVTSLAAQHARSPLAARQAADESLRFLRQALDHSYGLQADTDPDLAAIRNDPKFQEIMASVKNEEGKPSVFAE